MSVIALVGTILYYVAVLYFIVMFVRLIFDWVPMFNREWRPSGVLLVIAEIVYTLTDPPIRFFRRFIPPLRVGGIAMDFSFGVVMLLVFIVMSIARIMTYS
ncbi:MAG: YggT family protein [Microbacterium sp.]